MAQNVTIMGASYPDVPAVDLPKTGGGTARFADPSVTTAVAADVAAGKIFLNAQGEPTTGTGSGGGGGGTYTAHIEHTVGSSYNYPYVQLNGAGTKYYADGTDITFAEGDTLKITCYGIRDGGSIYVNGNQVAGSSQDTGYYTYTLPSHDVNIIIKTGSEGRVDVISDMNVQTVQSTSRRNNTELGSIVYLTCLVAGTYDIYWTCTRSSTSGTWGSQLYIDGSAYGSENTTWSYNVQNNHLTGVTIAANQTVAVCGRSRSGYYIYAPQLTIVQTA